MEATKTTKSDNLIIRLLQFKREMKKSILFLFALACMYSITMAQSPAMMTKSDKITEVDSSQCPKGNTLNVEIISDDGEHFHHPTHPENGSMCPTIIWFETSEQYAWYEWETSLPSSTNLNNYFLIVNVYYSGFIKVTAGDNNGNVGSDIIWFSVINHDVPPMEGFIMEIDDNNLSPTFYGIATENHHNLSLYRCFIPELYMYHEDFLLSPGEWIYNDTNAVFSEDTLWLYYITISDICGSVITYKIPGLLLNTNGNEYEGYHLSMKTILQRDDATFYYSYNFVYFIFTVDEYGNRHEFRDNNGNPIILQPETTSWPIPEPHIDPYYQVGVGRQLEDGSYELLSLSNKVPNPWPYSDGINEKEQDEPSFSIYPNPSNGRFTVEGTGQMTVSNLLGQIILTKAIDGPTTMELPQGLYFVQLGGVVRKVVVE